MSLTRQTQKVFGSNANANQLAVFGTMKTGTPVYSTNLATLQSTDYTKGWSEAILNDKAPYMEEMNAVQYGLSYQIAYLLQEGIGAYDANTNYSDTSIVKTFENGKLYFYHSLSDNNIGHSLDNTTYWEKINISDTRNIGEIVASAIPLTDAGLHLLDGSVLSGSGSYSQFVTYIANLYTADPTANYFTTEADWQTTVTNYGVCGKFVYDSVNNTVRLPKITGFVEGTVDATALGDLVEAGLPNITGNWTPGLYSISPASGAVCLGSYFNNSYAACTATGAFKSLGQQRTNLADDSNIIHFDASLANDKYGNSSTVQPQAVKVFYYIVIATSTKTNIEVDIDEIATDLNSKMDVDMSNMSASQTAINTIVGWSMPDYANGITITGLPYTVPDDGYIDVELYATNGITELLNNGIRIGYVQAAQGQVTALSGQYRVEKGDEITIYTGLGNFGWGAFYPLKGAN